MSVPVVESPYRGLRPFEDSDADAMLFFGREAETDIIAANLVAARLTVLYGPSGVGKSSVLRAGVMHRLRGDGDLVVRFESWSGDPVAGIADAVRAEVSDRLGEEVADVDGTLAERLEAWSRFLDTELYVVLDQVEEYFLYHGRNGRPDALLTELPDIVNAPGLRVNVLLGIREDALALLDAFKARIPQVLDNYLRLDRLDRDAGESAILGPLAAWNELAAEEVAAEPELVEALLDEVSVEGGRIEAPYLQVVLERIWDAERAAGSSLLRRLTLTELGGAERIIDEHLERALGGLDQTDRDTAAEMFGHLVTPGGTKIAHELRDLASYARRDVMGVTAKLVHERILRPVDGGAGGGRVEIYHDVLASAVADWSRRHEAERRLERERAAARDRQRRLAATVGVLLLGLALMTGFALYALSKRGEARDEATSASARELTAHALVQLDVDPELSMLLALEAARRERTNQIEDALRTALVTSRVRRIVRGAGPVYAAAFTGRGGVEIVDERRRRELGATTPPVASRDGSLLAFGRGATLVVASAGRENEVALATRITAVAVSGDGEVVAAGDALGRVSIHERTGLRSLGRFRLPERVAVLAVDGDGSNVVAARRRFVYSWNVSASRPGPTVENRASVTALALSPDGALVALGSADGAARLYDRESGDLLGALANHGHHVTAVAFSSDGSRLATASGDGLARTWRTEDGHLYAVLRRHTASVTSAAFDEEAGRLVTASADGTAAVWDSAASDELVPVMTGHAAFLDAAVLPDGSIAGADEQGVRLLDRRVVDARMSVAAFSRDARRVVGALDTLATVWRTEDGSVLGRVRSPSKILAAAASPTHVALGRADGAVLVRPIRGGRSVLLRGHGLGATAVGFSPDGSRIGTGDGAGVVRLWTLAGGEPMHVMRGHTDLVAGVSFSPDGRTLATASRDTNARTWDVATGRTLRTLVGHFAIVSEASFSPDQRWIVTAGPGTAGLWLRGAGPPGYIRSHADRVMSATFGPDNVTIVTASRDGTVRSYRCEPCRALDGLVRLARARLAHTGRTLTPAERRRYLHER